jgi:aconitate hydratase
MMAGDVTAERSPMPTDHFDARDRLTVGDRSFTFHRLDRLPGAGTLPFSLRILLENLLRHQDGRTVTGEDVEALARWRPNQAARELAFSPARVLMQDFTGVPAIVDLAAMREAIGRLGGDPAAVEPLIPAELVIDHSIVVDEFGWEGAFARNGELEYRRNAERYEFLRWGQEAFDSLLVVPPNTGICHQVNLEYLARVVVDGGDQAFPDTVVGTDSHTPMVNGLGVLGWGVGGIEAEAAMLGQPISMLVPEVVGFKLSGELPEGATATDLVLTVTEMLRAHGVVGKFVEFHGPGVASVSLENRATIGNMSPEYGSTATMFPIDAETLRYLRFTGRPDSHLALVEAYAKEQGLWHDPGATPTFSEHIELDLSSVVPCIAGPSRPQDRIPLDRARDAFASAVAAHRAESRTRPVRVPAGPSHSLPAGVEPDTEDEGSALSFPASDPPVPDPPAHPAPPRQAPTGDGAPAWVPGDTAVPVTLADGSEAAIDHGHVVIAAITSCTNTSNPSVMVAAGLVARNAVERGLAVKPWVKTSLAPGSKVVMDYYQRAGLLPYLETLRFHLVGFGCTTCIGNSGPLPAEISRAVADGGLAVAAVLSGNRNFEGRINPDVRLNYLASPPLVVAYALAGSMAVDLYRDPLGHDRDGNPVYLRDIWPSEDEIRRVVDDAVRSEMFVERYARVLEGDERWAALPTGSGQRFSWDPASTYVRRPPYFDDMGAQPPPLRDVEGARALAVLGDSVTTDHISPAGVIKVDSPAGQWLLDHGVDPAEFNSYGARRGNHEVMIRGTFANIRLRNRLAPGTEGGFTTVIPDGDVTTIYEASLRYAERRVPLVVLAGAEYGSGSSRDWAAKGTALLGVRAVVAQSFERIHRSNLIGMGVLPLELPEGETVGSLGLSGHERFDITGLAGLAPGEAMPAALTLVADGREIPVRLRIDTPKEADYYRHGGILHYVLRQLATPAA